MTECDRCGETFGSEETHARHVLDAHGDDVTSHERDELKRTLNRAGEDDAGVSLLDRVPVKLVGGLAVLIVAAVALGQSGMVSFSGGGGPSGSTGATQIGPAGSTHEHAAFSVIVDGDAIDFSQPRYQVGRTQDRKIHFEGGDGSTIHKHATGVTIGFALDSLGLGINATCLDVHGEAYCEGGGELTVTVDGQEIEDPANHVIMDGQTITIRYASDDGA